MYLVIFLGNVGPRYAQTRHNAAWLVCDQLFGNMGWDHDKYAQADISHIHIGAKHFVIAKPTTMMNKSGITAKVLADRFEIPSENITIVYDEIALDVGKLKASFNRGSGNHNGVISVINQLGTKEFGRLRLGVGHPGPVPMRNYVLTQFTPDELSKVKTDTADKTMSALKALARGGINEVMNSSNENN
jgi:PTH1 family peptidyl-tRNA hydrolase